MAGDVMTTRRRQWVMPEPQQYDVVEITDGIRTVVAGPFTSKVVADQERERLKSEYGRGVTFKIQKHERAAQ